MTRYFALRRSLLGLLAVSAAVSAALVARPGHADAQIHATPRDGRAEMELSLDHGIGGGSEQAYAEAALDLRLHSPSGFGLALRAGAAAQVLSVATAVELGASYRVDLWASERAAIQLGATLGATLAYGPFDRGEVPAWGGFAMVHLDARFERFFVGVGAVGHGLVPERSSATYGQPRENMLWSLTPVLRIGGGWGL